MRSLTPELDDDSGARYFNIVSPLIYQYSTYTYSRPLAMHDIGINTLKFKKTRIILIILCLSSAEHVEHVGRKCSENVFGSHISPAMVHAVSPKL